MRRFRNEDDEFDELEKALDELMEEETQRLLKKSKNHQAAATIAHVIEQMPDVSALVTPSAETLSAERLQLERDQVCGSDLIDAICERRLESAESLNHFSFTALVRAAASNEYVRHMVWQHWHYRPLPIRRYLPRTFVFQSPPDSRSNVFQLVHWMVLVGQEVALGDPVCRVINNAGAAFLIHSGMAGKVVARHCAIRETLRPQMPLVTFDGQTEIRLHDHQVAALKFMQALEERAVDNKTHGISGGIIRMEMGLGKTLTSIAHALLSPRPADHREPTGFPTLIISSKAVMAEWVRSGFHKFFKLAPSVPQRLPVPSMSSAASRQEISVLFLDKDYMSRRAMDDLSREGIVHYDFVVVSYDTVSSACKKGNYHEANLEFAENANEKRRILSVKPRTRAQSDDPRARGLAVLFKTPWERVFADESTRFANPKTKTYQYMMAIYGRFKYCLTGSPVVNQSTDIWSQLRFCGYTGVTRAKEWAKRYAFWMQEHQLNNYILSMDYDETLVTLPPIHRVQQKVVLDMRNTLAYDYVKRMARKMYDDVLSGAASYSGVLKMLLRLRQTCIAPHLMVSTGGPEGSKQTVADPSGPLDVQAPEIDVELQKFFSGQLKTWVHDKAGTAGLKSPKLLEIVNIVRGIPVTDKVVIFSMFTSALDLLAECLAQHFPDVGIAQVDGRVTGKKREAALADFRVSPKTRILLMTTRVGAFGLNLTEANHVIFLDIWWNAVAQQQAERRVYRPGQTKPVYSYTLLSERPLKGDEDSKKTVEDRILELCHEKDDLAHVILGAPVREESRAELSMDELKVLLK